MNIKITNCIICNGKKNHYAFSIDKFRIEKCKNCGMSRLNPQPSSRELSSVYQEIERTRSQNDNGSILIQHYLDLLEKFSEKSLREDLLIIGDFINDFESSKEITEHFFVQKIEYSTQHLNHKLSYDDVIIKETSQLLDTSKKFKYVIIFDIIEKIRNPKKILSIINKLLTENGYIVISLNEYITLSEQFKRGKGHNLKLDKLWYFSQSSLMRLLHLENFHKVKVFESNKNLDLGNQSGFSWHRLKQQLRPSGVNQKIFIAQKEQKKDCKKLSVVMAVFNEEKTVKNTIQQLLKKSLDNIELELIIVESQSTDNTRQILTEFQNYGQIKIIWQNEPRGKGNAIREGFKHVTGDIILIQDADDEYDFDDYDALIEPILSGETNFVLGARHGGSAWKMRQFSDQRLAGHVLNFGHWFFALLVNIFFNLNLKDPFTMFKVFRTDCLDGLKFECDRFDFDFELLIKLVKSGYIPIEIPVNYRSRSFKEGKKVQVLRDPLTWLRAIIKFRLQKA